MRSSIRLPDKLSKRKRIGNLAQFDFGGKLSVARIRALTCNVNLGRSINVVIPDSYKSAQKSLGHFIVIETEQYISQRGEYQCNFLAMADIPDAIPPHHIVLPQAHSLIAKVLSTEDPKKIGRVQVIIEGIQNWAIGNGNWLRVMSPNAGNTAGGGNNRGMVFVPEKGDQVIVGFLNGDTSQPYVMGSLFHVGNGQGGGENNNVKSIITKSGHIIELNDNEKSDWGIVIKDANGNKIHLNSKNKTIEISADEEIRFKSKNIYMLASEKLSLFGNKEIVMHSDENIDIESFCEKNIIGKENNIKGKEILDLSGNSLNIGAENDLLMYGQNTRLNGENNMHINAPAINMASGTDSFPFKDRVIEKEIVMMLKQ